MEEKKHFCSLIFVILFPIVSMEGWSKVHQIGKVQLLEMSEYSRNFKSDCLNVLIKIDVNSQCSEIFELR